MPQWLGSLGTHNGVEPVVWGTEPISAVLEDECEGLECEAATEEAVKPTMARATTKPRMIEVFIGCNLLGTKWVKIAARQLNWIQDRVR
jgi:hypothetical protein